MNNSNNDCENFTPEPNNPYPLCIAEWCEEYTTCSKSYGLEEEHENKNDTFVCDRCGKTYSKRKRRNIIDPVNGDKTVCEPCANIIVEEDEGQL